MTAVDFAPSAIKNLRTASREENVKLKIMEQDIFSLTPEYQNKFNYIIEQTCFCAIHPSRRQEYERLVKKLLKPDGLLIGLWFPLDKKLDEGGLPTVPLSKSWKIHFAMVGKLSLNNLAIYLLALGLEKKYQ